MYGEDELEKGISIDDGNLGDDHKLAGIDEEEDEDEELGELG